MTIKFMLEYLTIIQYVGIIIFCIYSLYYSVRWVVEVKERYSPLGLMVKVVHGLVSLAWALSYTYSLLMAIIGNPIDTNQYGISVIRPIILANSIYLAISAKTRYFIAKHKEKSHAK